MKDWDIVLYDINYKEIKKTTVQENSKYSVKRMAKNLTTTTPGAVYYDVIDKGDK